MAKTFYTSAEAAAKLGKSEDALTQMAREGKLREFRDAGKISYKVEEVDALAAKSSGGAPRAGSASGDLVLEPAEDSGLEIAMTGSDVLSLDEVDEEDTAAKTRAGREQKKKEGTVVPSVGVSVFDDDELDEVVDPLAQTQVTDAAGLGLEGVGSGSGILDLTRESDETSLGAELLDEIAPADDETLEMGEATRAGLEEAIGQESAGGEDILAPVGAAAAPAARGVVVRRIEYGPDAATSALTALMGVAAIVILFGGLAVTAMVRNVWPSPLPTIWNNMPAFAGGAAAVALIAALVTYFVSRRSS